MNEKELNEYKDTVTLLSQTQARLKSLLVEVGNITKTVAIAQQKEQQRLRKENKANKRLFCLMGHTVYESIADAQKAMGGLLSLPYYDALLIEDGKATPLTKEVAQKIDGVDMIVNMSNCKCEVSISRKEIETLEKAMDGLFGGTIESYEPLPFNHEHPQFKERESWVLQRMKAGENNTDDLKIKWMKLHYSPTYVKKIK
jgi:hypothetical protein